MSGRSLSQDGMAVHAGKRAGASVSVPEVEPIYASAVFRFTGLEQVDDVWTGRSGGYIYSRMSNPGVESVEDAINELEGGLSTVACSSGMAATAMAIEASVRPGGRIVAASVLYGATRTLLESERARRGIEVEFVDITDLSAVRAALGKGASMLLCECISNPLMEVADLPALADMAHGTGALFTVDNTFATPMLLRPFESGADLVIHSCTKYMNGHDDVTAGSVTIGRRAPGAGELAGAIKSARTLFGPVLSPFEAWLLLRGMRTLGVRMRRHSENASALAEALTHLTEVKRVLYPGIGAEEQGSTGCRLLKKGYGGMMSFELEGGLAAAKKAISGLRMAAFVPSLGSYATTVSHPASTSHRGLSAEERERIGISEGLIRVSVGIEEAADIVEDFKRAISVAGD